MLSMTYSHRPIGAGKSSFDLVSSARLFSLMGLKDGVTFLDVGCGVGSYTLAAARLLGPKGRALGLDLWKEGLKELVSRAKGEGLSNVAALFADAYKPLPLRDQSVDVILIATVLHDFIHEGRGDHVLQELFRVMRVRGLIAVLEFKKQNPPPGPPISIRISPNQVRKILSGHGLLVEGQSELGPHNYVVLSRRP
jgi:ubiquinone/menaquinone biosynthesis C-methylase UbiE